MSSVLEAGRETATSLPAWYETVRAEAWQEFERLPWPSRKDEAWRFGSPKEAQVDADNLALGGLSRTDLPELEGAIRFVFENNELVSHSGDIPEGLIALPLAQALADHEELLRDLLPPLQGKLGSRKLAALHRAKCDDGLVIHAGKGMTVEAPIEIIHVLSGEATVLPNVLIGAADGARLRVVERFVSANGTDATPAVAVSDVMVEDGAALTYLVTQDLNEHSKLVRLTDSRVGKGADSKVASIHIGGRWAREETYSTVHGDECKSEILSITVPTTGQEYDQRTFQHHAVGHAVSDLLYKNTLFGEAKTVFSGLIFVDEGAHHTDAYQTCRNLLMSDECEATSMPGLEINADQVKCSHGSTSARVSESEIFYLQARGISRHDAEVLVARGFSVEVVERLRDEDLEAVMLAAVDEKFRRVEA